MIKQLEDREDVSLLVNTFYENIRKDELLGPIFNKHIKGLYLLIFYQVN